MPALYCATTLATTLSREASPAVIAANTANHAVLVHSTAQCISLATPLLIFLTYLKPLQPFLSKLTASIAL